MRWVSPIGRYEIRNDINSGDGSYGAIRSSWTDGRRVARKHNGIDLVCIPGEVAYAPFDDFSIIRRAYPYEGNFELEGMFFETGWCEGRIWYVQPDLAMVGKRIKLGAKIGICQDVRVKYGPTMTPHIHFQIDNIDPMRC